MIEAYGGLGIVISMDDVNFLNNAFQVLWRDASAKQKRELDPVMAGWVHFFNRMRSSYIARATEWGELSNWQKKYDGLRTKFAKQGTKITAPYVARRAQEVTIDVPEEKFEKLKEAGGWLILFGAAGALGVGWLLWRMQRA